MNVFQTQHFRRQKKKLHPNQISALDVAVKKIAKNPEAGDQKKGDLSQIRVYKFKMAQQLCLLAYLYNERHDEITLIAVGTHENFYRDLKRHIN